MRIIPTLIATTAATLLVGCGTPAPSTDPGPSFDLGALSSADAKGRAFVAADAAIAAQMALYHLLAGLTQAAAKDLGKANPLASLGAVDTDATVTYSVDAATGTGKIQTTRKGQQSVALTFNFTRTATAHGFRYDVTDVTGTVEGYSVTLGPIATDFEHQLDANGQPITGADGIQAWTATLSTSGQLGYQGDIVATVKSLGFNLAWPVPASGTHVGTLEVDVPGQQATVTGDEFVGPESVATHGTVTLASDGTAFKLDMTGLGAVDIKQQN